MRKLFLFFFFLLMLGVYPMSVYAQQKLKFNIVKFELNQLDGTASNAQYKKVDGSGNLYAVIKVRSTDGDEGLNKFMFNFNSLKSIVEDKGDELWVYVQKNAKMVNISREGYTPLRNFDLNTTLQAGKTYYMEISYDRVEKVVVKELHMQMVSFKLTPAVKDAVVMYKKQDSDKYELLGHTDNMGVVSKNLAFGAYEYQVMADGYFTSEGIVKLDNAKEVHTENITLKSNSSNITLVTDKGADIYVNNEYKGKGRWTGVLKGGEYIVECKQQNHRPTSQSIVVEPNIGKTIELQKPTPITGYISVTSIPSGAMVAIDGKNHGTTPCNLTDVLIGSRKVEISKTGYNTYTQNIEVKEGEVANVQAKLSNVISAIITTYPTVSAKLYIDGKYKGTTPFRGDIAPGRHLVKIKHDRYKGIKESVVLTPKNSTLNYYLKRMVMRNTYYYLQGGVQVIGPMYWGGSLGAYINNFNVQLDYYMLNDCIDGYLYTLESSGFSSSYYEIDESSYMGARFGYGFILGSRFRLTPQLGVGLLNMDDHYYGFGDGHSIVGKLGLRMEMAIWRCLGFALSPEFSFSLKDSDNFKFMSGDSDVKALANGFKINAGMYFGF